MSGFAEGYIDVAARIAEFYEKHPDGSLQMDPPEWVEVDGAQFIMARAYAYRTPDDVRPGIGTAWEAVPGRTPYTRGSELMNLETSAWGRALAALGIATRQGIATAQEVEAAESRRGPITGTTARSGPLARQQARDGAQQASAKQVGYLKRLMREQGIAEHVLAEFAQSECGFDTPAEGLDHLTKWQASRLIDAVTKQVPKVETGPPADDPWQGPPPVDPQTGEQAS